MIRHLPALAAVTVSVASLGAWASRDIPQPSPSVTVHEWDDVPAIEPGTVLHLQMVPDGDHRERCAAFGGELVIPGYVCRNVHTFTPDKEAS